MGDDISLKVVHSEILGTREDVREMRKEQRTVLEKVHAHGTQLAGIQNRHDAEDAIRKPWYRAIVGVIVAAVVGLLGALAALLMKGEGQ